MFVLPIVVDIFFATIVKVDSVAYKLSFVRLQRDSSNEFVAVTNYDHHKLVIFPSVVKVHTNLTLLL